MTPLASLGAGDLVSSGIFPALQPVAAPLWYDGENVLFDNLGVRKAPGLLGLENLAARPTGLKSTVASTEARLFVGAGTKAYRYRTSDGLTEIGSFSASGGIYQFVPLDTWALISNGVDPVELWQNTGSSAAITAPFNRANVIFKYQLQAFAGGTNNGGQLVEWSPINSFTDWTPTLTNTAGNLRLRDLEGDIVAARKIGNSIGIYSASNGGLFTFLGSTIPYGFRNPISGVGAISPYSVVDVGNSHYGLTTDNVFVTDLVSFRYVDEPAVRRYNDTWFDQDRLTEVYGWHDQANSLVRWSIPKVGGGVYGLGYRYDRGSWTKFNDSVLLGEQAGPFRNMFLAKTARLLRQDKTSANNDGVAMPSSLQTKPLDLGDPNRLKRISKIALDITWSGAVNFSVGFSDSVNQTPTWNTATALSGSAEFFPDQWNVTSEGALLHMKIESTAAGATWSLAGADVYGEFVGYVA